MEENKEPPSGWKRARDTLNGARVTAQVVMHAVNPLYGPVAQHAHLEPVANTQEIVRQIDEREIRDEADWELRNREEEVGQIVRTENPARQDKSRQMHTDLQVRKSPSRDRQRDR
jgi:hypothetical protein